MKPATLLRVSRATVKVTRAYEDNISEEERGTKLTMAERDSHALRRIVLKSYRTAAVHVTAELNIVIVFKILCYHKNCQR
jgi:hypothetical protein